MTLSQIIAQALRQLGEDPQDVSEYEETFKIYANVGYDIAAVLVGGGLSLLASGNPDGLEWSLFGNSDAGYTQNMGLDEDSYGVQSSAADKAGTVQEKTAFLPDYSFAGSDSSAGTSVSGIAGAAIVAAAAALICGVGGICRHKKNHSQ